MMRGLRKTTLGRRALHSHGSTRRNNRFGTCRVRAEKLESTTSIDRRVEELRQLTSGTGNGTQCTPERRATVEALVQELERSNSNLQPASLPLRNTSWTLLYSNTSGNSSGKLGPFVGRVTQEFDEQDGFANTVDLGVLKVTLNATYETKNDQIIVVRFRNTELCVFGFKLFSKAFERTAVGSWKVTYASSDLRILYSNQDNLFVLARS